MYSVIRMRERRMYAYANVYCCCCCGGILEADILRKCGGGVAAADGDGLGKGKGCWPSPTDAVY